MPTSDVFNFIIDSLKVAGASYNVINNELIMAQCQVNVPRTFFTPARIETQSLQIVCQPSLLEKYPGSELVIQGSYRLQWFMEGIRKRGLICKGAYHYELDYRKIEREINSRLPSKRPSFFYKQPFLSYHSHLLVNFKVTLETDEKLEEMYSLSINLINGEISSNLLDELKNKKISAHLPKKPEKKKIPYSEGYQALHNHLKWLLQNHDTKWVETAKARWTEEVSFLEDYYREERKDSRDEGAFYRQAAEIYRKFRPVIRIEIINICLLYLPIVVYTLEAWGSINDLPPIIYDPVRQKIKWNIGESSQIPKMV